MKVNNFQELDQVLKNSFSSVRKDMSEFQKKTTKHVQESNTKIAQKQDSLDKEFKKISVELKTEMQKQYKKLADLKDKDKEDFIKNSKKAQSDLLNQVNKEQKLTDTKLQTVTKEVKNFKEDLKAIQNNQKELLLQLKQEMQKVGDNNVVYTKKEIKQLENEVEDVKKNIVKMMGVLREKLVSKDTFDQRNEAYEKFLRDVLEQTKDLDKVKLSYFTRTSVNSQLESTEKKLKEVESSNKEILEKLESLSKQQEHLVHRSAHEDSTKQVQQLRSDLESLHSNFNAHRAEASTKFEAEKIHQSLSAMSSERIQAESTLKLNLSDIADELKEIRAWKKDIQTMQKQLEKHDEQVQQNKIKIDLIQDMNLTSVKESMIAPQVVERPRSSVQTVSEFFTEEEAPRQKVDVVRDVEQMLEQKSEKYSYNPPSLQEEPGVFSKIKDGIVNFFFAEVEEEPARIELPPETVPEEPKKKEKPIVLKPEVENPEAFFEEPEAPTREKQYMSSRRPKIFEEIESSEPGSRKKKYKRVQGDDVATEPNDEVYYPEDYFY